MALFVFSLCPFDISVGVGAFVIGLSQISSFLSTCTFVSSELLFQEGGLIDMCIKYLDSGLESVFLRVSHTKDITPVLPKSRHKH